VDDERLLEAAGLSELEEWIYIALLSRQGLSLAEVADQHGINDRKARTVLDELEAKGLIGRSAIRPIRYVPAPPGAAVEALLLRRRETLERARMSVDRLVELFRSGAGAERAPSDLVQLADGHEAVAQRLSQALLSAQTEVLGLGKAPLATPSDDYIDLKLQLLRRGVSARTVYEAGALYVLSEFLARATPAGEQSRVAHELPMRLIIVDRNVGLTPLHTDAWDQWLVVQAGPLLDGLIAVFDAAWARGRAIMAGAADTSSAATSRMPALPAATQQVVMLLAAGLRDKTIGEHLGMNVRTVERHVTRAMELLGARTRFEAGILATRKGWLDAPMPGTPARGGEHNHTSERTVLLRRSQG